MGKIISLDRARLDLQKVQAVYSVREISKQFGIPESYLKKWAAEEWITADPSSEILQFDFSALKQFRRIRELRHQGLSLRQIETELRGQLNLFTEKQGQLVELPQRLSPFEKGLLLFEQGVSQAAEAFRKAIEAGDCASDAWCNLGIIEFEAGRQAKSLHAFASALKADPLHFESHFNLGCLYLSVEDLKPSRLHFETAAEIEPEFPGIYFNLGIVCALLEDFESSIASFEKYRSINPAEDTDIVLEILANLRAAFSGLPRKK